MNDGIDFVVPWVDGSDKAWQAEKARYSCVGTADASPERYRDWDILRYWFRGVEKFAPWVRKVHFITWGHLPVWLNVEHPKLHIVRHEDYIPKEFLPTFSSHPIELNLHRIEGLSERFVYFNDDMFLIRPAKPEDFFQRGKPCDMLALYPSTTAPKSPLMSHLYLNNMLVLCKYFDKRENIRRQPWAYYSLRYPPKQFLYNLLELAWPLYTRLYTTHGPTPFCKRTFLELWVKEEPLLRKTSANRFRGLEDVTQYLFRDWQKLSGNFHPVNTEKNFGYFDISANNQALARTIARGKKKVICVNDAKIKGDFDAVRAELHVAFEQILPEHSAFEVKGR